MDEPQLQGWKAIYAEQKKQTALLARIQGRVECLFLIVSLPLGGAIIVGLIALAVAASK